MVANLWKYDTRETPMIGDLVAPVMQPSLRALVVDIDLDRENVTVHFVSDVNIAEVVQSPLQYILVKRGRR